MANRMHLQRTKSGQFTITVPRAVVEALGLKKGAVLEFRLNDKGELVLKRT